MMVQAAEPGSQLRASLVSPRLARRHAAVVLLGETGRAAAHAIAEGFMPAPVVFLLLALEPEAGRMTMARLCASRRNEQKSSGGP